MFLIPQTALIKSVLRMALWRVSAGGVVALLSVFPGVAATVFNDLEIEPTARYRYQQVNDAVRGDAQASTLKLRLSASYEFADQWQVFGQYDQVYAFNPEGYNSVAEIRPTSPLPEPRGGELNELFVRYESFSDWFVKLGRQAIRLDNQRHVGTVEFWQNDQTFDAINIGYNDNLHWQANYYYVRKVHRIFGDDARATINTPQGDVPRSVLLLGNHDHNTHLVNIQYRFDRRLNLTAYAYLLDNDNARGMSSNTFGVRATGEFKPNRIKYGYTLEYANQQDSGDSPWLYNADYVLLEASAQLKSHQVILSWERMGDDNGFGFSTSLGSNHRFGGWTDVLAPYAIRGGIVDRFVTYRGRKGKLRWRVLWHNYERDAGGQTIGEELNVEIAYRYTRDWEFKLIGSKYFADQGLASQPQTQSDISSWIVQAAYNL